MSPLSLQLCAVLFVLLAYVQQGSSLKCYACEACAEKGPYTELECPAPALGVAFDCCMTLTVGGIVNKNCGVKAVCSKLDDCKYCDSDLCNSSSRLSTSFALSICAIFLAKYFM